MGILSRYAGFRSLWIGQLLSQFGNAVFLIMGLWEIQLRSPFLLSIAGLAMVIPSLLAAAGGVLVDRYDAGRMMLYTDLLRGCAVAAGMVALLVPGSLVAVVIVLLGVNSLGAALFSPGEAIMIPRLVTDADLTAANGIYNLTAQASGAIGSAIGGAAIAGIGAMWVFGFDMGSFWISALAIALMLRTLAPQPHLHEQTSGGEPHSSFFTSMRDGMAAVRKLPAVIELLPIVILTNFAFMAAFTMLPYWINHILHANALWYGLIDAGWAVGLVTGSVTAGYLSRLSTRTASTLMFGLEALLFGAFAFSGSALLSGILLLLGGITNGIGNAVMFTLLQRLIPEAVRGRAFGLIFTLFGLANPLGALAAGVFLHILPPYLPWIFAALSTLALAIGMWRVVPNDLPVAQETPHPLSD
ncbi:MAG: MFS transporter [Thermaerobacter sp.]|nr:MFS transporter [Thermaerobacter sp.]